MEVEEADMVRVALVEVAMVEVVAQEVELVRAVVKLVLDQDLGLAIMEAVGVVSGVAMEVAAVGAVAEVSLLMEEACLVDMEAILAVDTATVRAEDTGEALVERVVG